MSSTDHIYHRAAKLRGDEFDRSMTRGKLLGNNAPLFIFISILKMTQLHPRDQKTDKRTDSRNGDSRKNIYNRLLGKCGFISANNALFVSVDLIGEKNQVILKLPITQGYVGKFCRAFLSYDICIVLMFANINVC